MKYIEYKPIDTISDYIQLIWVAESESQVDIYPREKILPDGIVEIIFHFGEPFVTYNSNGEKIKQPNAFAVSQMRKFIEIESEGEFGFVSIRFYPWGAHHFFDEPIKNFIDNTIDLKHLWSTNVLKILEKIKNVENTEKVKIIQQFLSECLHKYKKSTNYIDEVIKKIRETKAQDSVGLICQKTNLNYKQLERKFIATIGTTPKVFTRTTRFLHLCHHLNEYKNKPMAQLTYELGYFDQAHFIKDFKAFSGLTPKEYYSQNNICFADI